jgi:hypothetical protein
MTAPQENPVSEGERITEAASDRSITLRVAGGVGVALRCPSASSPPLTRTYADVDLVGRAKEREEIERLVVDLGYEPDTAFNALHGARRLFFWDGTNERQLDVFLDTVEMCHKLQLADRLAVDSVTLSIADLLLMKLQIFETNAKDMLDITTLFVDQELTEDDTGINMPYIERLTRIDWGLWKTITMVAEKTDHFSRSVQGLTLRSVVHSRISGFLERLQASEKSRRWKLRARIGEKVRWYELPEEVR